MPPPGEYTQVLPHNLRYHFDGLCGRQTAGFISKPSAEGAARRAEGDLAARGENLANPGRKKYTCGRGRE
jgi:hypothetical protein